MSTPSQSVPMFCCYGWQNVRQYSEKHQALPVRLVQIPAEHAHAVMDYTHARAETLEALVAGLKEAAGAKSLRIMLVD